MIGEIVREIEHNGHSWQIARVRKSYFARYGTSDTGPYATEQEAVDWIRAIRADEKMGRHE